MKATPESMLSYTLGSFVRSIQVAEFQVMQQNQGIIKKRIASFRFALQGVGTLFRTQIHAWVHLVATIVVAIAGIVCDVTRTEWALLILAIGMVWTAEALNTAIEFAVDLASPDHNELAGNAKDVAAAAVLLASFAAVGIAVCVFSSYVSSWLS